MGNILTSNQLKRRGSQLSGKCYLCKVKEETMDHILLHCSKAVMLWQLIYALLGVQ